MVWSQLTHGQKQVVATWVISQARVCEPLASTSRSVAQIVTTVDINGEIGLISSIGAHNDESESINFET